VDGDGVLWHRWQFSAHNWDPDFADTFWLVVQLFTITITGISSITNTTKMVFFLLYKALIFYQFIVE
jgi:hypothetical protein